MPYVIAKPCIGVKDTACIDACPVDAIHPRINEKGYAEAIHLFINPPDCICCSACVPVCPVSAIFLEEELPSEWIHFAAANKQWFEEDVAGKP